MQTTVYPWGWGLLLLATASVVVMGCYNTPVEVDRGAAPLRLPQGPQDGCSYEDSLTGGQIFSMYCCSCHNARSLAERPFSNYQNVAAHMRVRANLTGKEYGKLVAWLRRWHDVPGPELHEVPSPKRFIFGQPISELREQQPKTATDPVAGPRPGATDEASPGQPPPGNAPREAR